MISRLNFTGDFEFFISQNNLNFIDIIENLDRSKNLIIVTYNIFTKTNLILERLKLLENFEEIIIITNIPGRFEQYYGNQNEKARKERSPNHEKRASFCAWNDFTGHCGSHSAHARPYDDKPGHRFAAE